MNNFEFKLPKLESLNLNSAENSSLQALASDHLASNSGFAIPTLSSKSTSEEEPPTSLQALANLHLDQNNSQGFSIPSIFGPDQGPKQILLPNNPAEKSPEKFQKIDLSLALKPREKPTVKPKKKEEKVVIKKSLEVQLLIEEIKENCQDHQKSKGSNLGKVLTRKWKRKSGFVPYLRPFQSDVKPFLFDTKSPDDIVRAAQSQVFTRHK